MSDSDPYAADPYAADPYAADPYGDAAGFGGAGPAETAGGAPVATSPTAADLRSLADQLFVDMLGFSVTDGDEPPHDQRTAVISITGEQSACLLVSMSDALSRSLASCMFDIPEAALDGPQVADAVGEVVNILGGNVKPMLGDDLQLGLPSAGGVMDQSAAAGVRRTVVRVRVDDEPLEIRLNVIDQD